MLVAAWKVRACRLVDKSREWEKPIPETDLPSNSIQGLKPKYPYYWKVNGLWQCQMEANKQRIYVSFAEYISTLWKDVPFKKIIVCL